MTKTLSDSEKKIKQIPINEWEKLFKLIPAIEKTKVFSKSSGAEKLSDGTITLPFIQETKVIQKFRDLSYDLGIVYSFDWSSWERGRNLLNNPATDFNKLNLITLCKLVTAIVRNDRFSDGALVRSFKNGTILKILYAMKSKVYE